MLVGTSAWLGDRKFSKPECQAAALALSLVLRWPIPIFSFPVGFIFSVGNSRFQSSFFLKLASSISAGSESGGVAFSQDSSLPNVKDQPRRSCDVVIETDVIKALCCSGWFGGLLFSSEPASNPKRVRFLSQTPETASPGRFDRNRSPTKNYFLLSSRAQKPSESRTTSQNHFCRTSQISHDPGWRGACASTTRDNWGRCAVVPGSAV